MDKWRKKFKLDSDICQIFQANDSFGIICHNSIHFYNSNKQIFDSKIKLKKGLISGGCYYGGTEQDSGHMIIFDKINNILYYKDPMGVNEHSKKWMIINIKTMEINKMYNGTNQTNYGAKGIIINNKLHLIGGKLGIHHRYDPILKQYTKVTDSVIPSLECEEDKQILISSTNGQKMYFFGTDRMMKVVTYTTSDNKWYDLSSMDFTELLGDYGAICVKNDKYIILFGGIDHGDGLRSRNDIFIMDIELRKWGKCDIKCPVRGSVKCIVNNDKDKQEKTVSGYTKYLCKNGELDHERVPPIYLIRMIGKYVECEMVYLFWKYLGWTISVDALLNNTHFN